MRFRRGFSLIELLIVLSVGTVMLMVAVSVLYLLKEAQVNLRERLSVGRMITRLADQFRDDVHRASSMERGSDEAATSDLAVWKLTIDADTVVLYEMRDGAVRRVRIGSRGKIQDDYRLPSGMGAAITAPEGDSDPATLRLEVSDASTGRSRPIQVEALLGFANRHTQQADGSGE
jgi:prepilin-type N-terminal cleavage/methylation domain-containing protein